MSKTKNWKKKDFFNANELKTLDERYDANFSPDPANDVTLDETKFYWDDDREYIALDNVSYAAKRGKLNMIVGRVKEKTNQKKKSRAAHTHTHTHTHTLNWHNNSDTHKETNSFGLERVFGGGRGGGGGGSSMR